MYENLWVVLLTGFTIGSFSCLAVQGGLLASLVAGETKSKTLYITSYFLASKLFSYIILGFVLGFFGQFLSLSDEIQIFMQFIAGVYMLLIALNMLELHPIFRYVVITPPKFLLKLARAESKSKDFFAPILLGFLTIFIPCGTTLAIETYAISFGDPIFGALIMGVFTLGTIPAFLGISVISSVLNGIFKSLFVKIAAGGILYLGLFSIWGSLNFWYSSTAKLNDALKGDVKYGMDRIPSEQIIEINVTSSGYSPSYIKVKQGDSVIIKLIGQNTYSCASAFRIPSLRIKYNLAPTETKSFVFNAEKPGKVPFTCSMGMFTGIIEVI
jgi:sulfite exporter TauE/SafE